MGKRTVFISDTHGFLEEAIVALHDVGVVDEDGKWIDEEATLVHLGDFVDRGPDPTGAYQYFKGLPAVRLMGNHDFQYANGPEFGLEEEVFEVANEIHEDAKSGSLQFAHRFEGKDGDEWLCIHAGLVPRWKALHNMPMQDAVDIINEVGRAVANGERPANAAIVEGIGRSRGGRETPGVTWADYYDDLLPAATAIKHKQIVGHSIQMNGINLNKKKNIWAVNVMYGHSQCLVYDHETGEFSTSGRFIPEEEWRPKPPPVPEGFTKAEWNKLLSSFH